MPARARLLVCAVLMASVSPSFAQREGSLTDEFAKMSPKERARVARQEQEDAAKDTAYQRIMAQAETEFKQKRYDEALSTYQNARKRRPLNVNPKVKIEDLQVLITQRDAARAAEAKAATPSSSSTVAAPGDSAAKVVVPKKPEPKPVESQPRVQPKTTKVEAPVVPKPQITKPVLPEGVTERTYMEGRAIVLERTISTNGHAEVYRKVTHPYGQVNYFRDGSSIPERMWIEAGGH